MSFHSQSQSSFITRLPLEIREAIYLELWRSVGLRQHIILHWKDKEPSCSYGVFEGRTPHLARWPCTTDFYVGDSLQEELEVLRTELGVPWGERIASAQNSCRLYSGWLDHWPCEERLLEWLNGSRFDGKKQNWIDPPGASCWCEIKDERIHERRDASTLGSYMSMLLSCKIISIYESTTFILNDSASLQAFFGSCELHQDFRMWFNAGMQPPAAFFRHARNIEVSTDLDVALHPRCCWSMENRAATDEIMGDEEFKGGFCADLKPEVHDLFDFHWLRLNMFENLQSVKIWASVMPSLAYGGMTRPAGFEHMDAERLKASLLAFANVKSVTLSVPLGRDLGTEGGYIEGVAPHEGIKVWKRGPGVRFYPSPRGCVETSYERIIPELS